jgi:hypothetical protein
MGSKGAMQPLHSLYTALFVLRHLFAVSLLAGAALGCGDRVTTWMRWMDDRECWLASIVLGLGMLATLFFALGALRLLYPAIAWLVLVPLFALSMRGGAKRPFSANRNSASK